MNSEILDRLPPSDTTAEMKLLGSIILKASVLDDVAEIIRPEDFYGDANRRLYLAIQAMRTVRLPVDDIAVTSDWLRRTESLRPSAARPTLPSV